MKGGLMAETLHCQCIHISLLARHKMRGLVMSTAHGECAPSGHKVEHVVAESQILVLGQYFGTLGHICHLNEWDQLIRVLEYFPELAHVARLLAPFLLYIQTY